jgi:integrase
MSKTVKKFPYVSLYPVNGRWRLTTCKVNGRRITRRLGVKQGLAERFAAQVSDWLEQWKSKLMPTSKLMSLLGESLAVDQLLQQYRRHLKSKGREKDYINTTIPRVRILLERGEITRASHITVSAVNASIESLAANGPGGRKLSDQTLKHYATAIKQFVSFMMKPPHKIFEVNPLVGLDGRRVDKKVRTRRAPTPLELSILLKHVEKLPIGQFDMKGADRAMVYAYAIATGLRVGELREVKRGWVDLNKGVIAVPGEHTKNGEPAYQPLPGWLIERSKGWLEGKDAGTPLWPNMPNDLAIGLRADQTSARKAWIDASVTESERAERVKSSLLLYKTGEGYFDMHALRHAYVTRVVASGATVKTAQSLARHSDAALTIGLYSHVEAEGLRPQVDAAIPNPF